MATAVVEFNSLPDPVGPAAEDDDFLFVRGRGLVFILVCGVKIWREALEFGGAGVDALVDRHYSMFLAQMPDLFLTFEPPDLRQTAIGESHALGITQHLSGNGFHGMFFQLELLIINLFELV